MTFLLNSLAASIFRRQYVFQIQLGGHMHVCKVFFDQINSYKGKKHQ